MGFLSDARIRAAKPKDKAYKLFDTPGLYLRVSTSGARLWRFKYSLHGRERLLSLGQYPDVPPSRAREKTDEARRLVSGGIDPAIHRLVQKNAKADTFAVIAAEWLELQRKRFAPATMEKAEWTFRDLINPYIRNRPIADILPLELLTVFRRLETRGKHETAHRTKQGCGQVFRYAVATGRVTRDPTQDLRGALAPVATTHHAAVTEPRRIGELLRALHSYVGLPVTEAALKLAPPVFVRPGELRKAEWSEFDLDTGEWRIPASRMKMRQQHVVPLATQSLAILRDLHPRTGRGRYAFPSPQSRDRPMSENASTAALRRMGYSGQEMTSHGFRTIASTSPRETNDDAGVGRSPGPPEGRWYVRGGVRTCARQRRSPVQEQ